MASPDDNGLSTGSLLADVLQMKPGLIELLALCLDREMRLIPNWKHLSEELKVDAKVITRLERCSFSPTIRLFEYLEITKPDLSILQLKNALLDIKRNDLFRLLTTKAGCVDSEVVKEVITSRDIRVPSPRAGLLDEMALALDSQSLVLADWKFLGAKLGVPRKILKQFERSSVQSPTNRLFEYLAVTRPQLTLKTLMEVLLLMNRNDLIKFIGEENLGDEVLLTDVMKPGSPLLQTVADELNIDHVPWAKNWRHLAYHLEIPSDVYQEFDGSSAQRESPTREILQWLVVRTPDIVLSDVVKALDKIKRNDAIQIITSEFSDTVDSSLEHYGTLLNNNSSFELSIDPTGETLSSPREKRSESGSSFNQEEFKQCGHRGSLPDVPCELKGRDDICEQIITSLNSNEAIEIVAAHGYGKTSVVVEVGHRMIAMGKTVAYVNPRGVTCVEDLGSKIIEALGEVPGEKTIEECLRRIRALNSKILLIIENLDNLFHLEEQVSRERENQKGEKPLRNGDKNCCKMQGQFKKDDFLSFLVEIGKSSTINLLLTSTEASPFFTFPIKLIKLQPLSHEDSSKVFKKYDRSLDENTLNKLVKICGGIPLIICTMLSLLEYENPQTLADRLLSSQAKDLMKELSPDYLPYEERIYDCLEDYFSRLSQKDQDVLVMLSTFPQRFTQEQFCAVFRSQTDIDLNTCINTLKHSSFLPFEKTSCHYSLPSYIRTFCSVQPKHAEAKSLFLRHYSDVIVGLNKEFFSKRSKSAVTRYWEEKENIREAMAWCGDDHPDLDDDLREHCIDAFNKAAVFLAKVMRKQEFESLFCKLAKKFRHDLPRYSACLTAIGMKIVLGCTCTPQICSRALNRGKSVLTEAFEIQSLVTVDDATRAHCLSKLGFCLVREGLCEDGFGYLDQALALRKKHCEESGKTKERSRVMLAACYNDLAASQMLQRKHIAAIETRRNFVLPEYEAILGKQHPFVATTLGWIAKSYHELGDYDNAIAFAKQALDIRETLLGHHQETARSHYDLGDAYLAKKDFDRALEHLEQAVQLQEEVLDTHEELIFTHQAMAIVLKELGRDEDANRENERAGECAKKLDPLEVPLNTIQTHEEKGWEVTDPVPIGST